MKWFFIFFILLVFLSGSVFPLSNYTILKYRDDIKSFVNNSSEISLTLYYKLEISPNKGYYDCYFELENIVPQINMDQELLNITRIFTNGFRTNFMIDQNFNFIYSPNIEYLYLYDELYKKYKDKIDEKAFRDFASSMFNNFFDWFGKLKNKNYTDLIKYSFYFENNVFYNYNPNMVNLSLSKKNYSAILHIGQGNVNNLQGSIFNGLKLINGKINSYEYYDKDNFVPLLLQREMSAKLDILDPNFKNEYIKKYNKPYIEYKLQRSLMLIYHYERINN